MKKLKEVSGSKQFLYGVTLTVVSLVALTSIYSVKEGVMEENRVLWENGDCFRVAEGSEVKSDASTEDQKAMNRECMSVRNKVSQIKYGTPLFVALLLIGTMLLVFSFVEIKSSADKAVEEFEKEEASEGDNKLS
jgi:hypothetical protein